MLILSREKKGQIIVGENIVITVVSISGNRVRLGFEAPPDVKIVRSEISKSPLVVKTVDPDRPGPPDSGALPGKDLKNDRPVGCGKTTYPG